MFTDLLNLPLDKDRASQADQVLRLSNMNWADYEALTNEEYLGYKASYFDQTVTIVSPSLNHEIVSEVISGLIKAYCRYYGLPYFPMGSTTLKNPPLAGKEPDASYTFGTRKATPDLAVEVIYSSGDLDDSLKKYSYLKVEEVWFWQNKKMKFYRLDNSNYIDSKQSYWLDKITPEFLVKYVNRGLTESPLSIEADFMADLDSRN